MLVASHRRGSIESRGGERGRGLCRTFSFQQKKVVEGGILCELKGMSASNTRYPIRRRLVDGARAVDRRANGLTDEYAQKARETDWNYCGIARPPRVPLPGVVQPVRQIGPVETKLLSYGRVRVGSLGHGVRQVRMSTH